MRTILAAVVLAASAAGLGARDDKKDDKKFESKAGKFAAKFPAAPTTQTKSAGGLTLNVFAANQDKGGYLVIYSDLPPDALKAPKPEQVLESSEKGLKENFQATISKSAATTFGPKKYPARELTAERNEFHMRGTIVLVGTRLYQVYVFGPKDFITTPEADAFLASFEITP